MEMTTPITPETKKQSTEYVVRFKLRQRIEHIALIVVFTLLAVTGLLQRYYTFGPAEWLILNLGGIDTLRAIHRTLGIVFSFGFLYHVAIIISDAARRKRLSMLISRKDFSDVVDSLKYSAGRGPRPQFGRYNYRQKFEYWGLMFGSIIITVTGLVLMFPVLVTRLLPGQVVAASVQIHGWEATLAVLTILVWHLYEVVLRPDVFPADTSIFTGRISKERMEEEHYLDYRELVAPSTAPAVQTRQAPPKAEPIGRQDPEAPLAT